MLNGSHGSNIICPKAYLATASLELCNYFWSLKKMYPWSVLHSHNNHHHHQQCNHHHRHARHLAGEGQISCLDTPQHAWTLSWLPCKHCKHCKHFIIYPHSREAPFKFMREYLGIAQMGGGGSTLARMVWGNFFGKNLLDFGGSRPLSGWFGVLFPKWSAPECPFEWGGGQSYLGIAQIGPVTIWVGLP